VPLSSDSRRRDAWRQFTELRISRRRDTCGVGVGTSRVTCVTFWCPGVAFIFGENRSDTVT
jgi:hypothetical protein